MSEDTFDKGKLRWRCRRGMRELDQAMLAYLDNSFDSASIEEKKDFIDLLDWQEPELYKLISGKETHERYQNIINKIAGNLVDNASRIKNV